MIRLIILSAGLALASFAAYGAIGLGDCKTIDWYKFGLRDGSVSGRSSLDEYTAQCAKSGVTPDAAQYAKGLEAGQWEKAHRRF